MLIKGKAHKFGDFINTDIHCSSKYMSPETTEQQALDSLFSEIKPSFSKTVQPGDILVAGESFGTVSTREDAPMLLRKIGVQAVVAKSFGYLFYRNAINLGLLILECNTDDMQDNDHIEINLETLSVKINDRETDIKIKTRYSNQILNILKDGGLIGHLKKNKGYKLI
jgi:3-isopropylmalate/(R)-2-methylmalate dehydratase small subunit